MRKQPRLFEITGTSDGLAALASRVKPYVPVSRKFHVRCPKPGCKYTAATEVGPLRIQEVKPKPPGAGGSRLYIIVRHFREFKGGKHYYDVHMIGRLTRAGPELYYDSPDADDIIDKTKLRADAMVAAESNGPGRRPKVDRALKAKPTVSPAQPRASIELKVETNAVPPKPPAAEPAAAEPPSRPLAQVPKQPAPAIASKQSGPASDNPWGTVLSARRRTTDSAPVHRQEPQKKRSGIEGIFDVYGGYPSLDDLRKAGVTDGQLDELVRANKVYRTLHANYKDHPRTIVYAFVDELMLKESDPNQWRYAASAMYDINHKK